MSEVMTDEEREAKLAKISARIDELIAHRPRSDRTVADERRRLRAKVDAARARLADELRKGRATLNDEQWIAMLAQAGIALEEAEEMMQPAPELPVTAPASAPMLVETSVRVYFIQAIEGGPIKIGMSQNPERRLADLQVGSPVRLRIIGVAVGGQQREAALHRRLAKHRVHGEWFADAPEVMAAIAEVLR